MVSTKANLILFPKLTGFEQFQNISLSYEKVSKYLTFPTQHKTLLQSKNIFTKREMFASSEILSLLSIIINQTSKGPVNTIFQLIYQSICPQSVQEYLQKHLSLFLQKAPRIKACIQPPTLYSVLTCTWLQRLKLYGIVHYSLLLAPKM